VTGVTRHDQIVADGSLEGARAARRACVRAAAAVASALADGVTRRISMCPPQFFVNISVESLDFTGEASWHKRCCTIAIMRAVFFALAVAACGEPSRGDSRSIVTFDGDAATNGCAASALHSCVQDPYGDETCTNVCKPSEYGLICSYAQPAMTQRCTIVPVPTPAGLSLYCCPSAP
jgi:hypothetical protein